MSTRGNGVSAEASEPPREGGRRKRVLASHAAELPFGALELRFVEARRADKDRPGQAGEGQGSAAKGPAPSHVGIVETTRQTRQDRTRHVAELSSPSPAAPTRPGFGQIAEQLVSGQPLPGTLFGSFQRSGGERSAPCVEPPPKAATSPQRLSKACAPSAADPERKPSGGGRVKGRDTARGPRERPFPIFQEPRPGPALPGAAGAAPGDSTRGPRGSVEEAPNSHSVQARELAGTQRFSLQSPRGRREQPQEGKPLQGAADTGSAQLAQQLSSAARYPAAPNTPALPSLPAMSNALPEFPEVCAQLAQCSADGNLLAEAHAGAPMRAAPSRNVAPSPAALGAPAGGAAAPRQEKLATSPSSSFNSTAPARQATGQAPQGAKGPHAALARPKLRLALPACRFFQIRSRFPTLPWLQIALRQPVAQHSSSLQIRPGTVSAGVAQGNAVEERLPRPQENKWMGQRGPLLLSLRLQLWAPVALLSIPCLPRQSRHWRQSAPLSGGPLASETAPRSGKMQEQASFNVSDGFQVIRGGMERALAPTKDAATSVLHGTLEILHQTYKREVARIASVPASMRLHATQALNLFRQDLAFVLQAADSSRQFELGRLPPSAAHVVMHGVVAASLLPDTLAQLARLLGAQTWGSQNGRRALVPRALPGLRCRKGRMLEAAETQSWPAFGLPVEGGWLSSLYGWRDGRFHQGIDIAVEENTAIAAAAAGTVLFVGWKGGYGKVVHIDHGDGCQTLYAHCNRMFVKKGQVVRKRQRIALSGNTGKSTGPHLHFEIQRNGGTVDPLMFLPQIDHTKLPLYR